MSKRQFRTEIHNNLLYVDFFPADDGMVVQLDVYRHTGDPFIKAMDEGKLGMSRFTYLFDKDTLNEKYIRLEFDRMLSRPKNQHERMLRTIKNYLIDYVVKCVNTFNEEEAIKVKLDFELKGTKLEELNHD